MRLAVIALLAAAVCLHAAVDEATIRKHLPGTWVARIEQPIRLHGTTTYVADGTVSGKATMTPPGGAAMELYFKGTWKIAGDKVMVKIVESSHPQMMPVGVEKADTVLAIDAASYRYRDAEGTEMTETRAK